MTTSRVSVYDNLTDRLFQAVERRSSAAVSLLQLLCQTAEREGSELYLVGGLIRDELLDTESAGGLDIDLAIDGETGSILSILESAAGRSPTLHDRFGTASVALPDGVSIDVARTRRERYDAPGALPAVSWAPIAVDLGRRDFTINAVALPLTGASAGRLIDPHSGVADIEQRVIRALHTCSFRDDPTRLVRAARYASRIGGALDRATLEQARRERRHIAALSVERFGDAWRLLLQEPDSRSALSVARRLQIPQSRETRWSVPPAVLEVAENPESFWAGMGLLSQEPQLEHWLPKSVGMHRQERSALEGGAALRRARRRIGGRKRASSVARALRQYPDSALQAAAISWRGASGVSVREFLAKRSEIPSPISAQRLIELGVEPGPALGNWLHVIEDAIWDGELDPDDDDAVTRLEQRIRWSR